MRLALLLGRYWPWITPEYLFNEMTMEEVYGCLAHIGAWELHAGTREQHEGLVKAMQDWLVEGRKQDLGWLKGPLGKVIRKNGR